MSNLANSNSAYEFVALMNNQGQIIKAISPYQALSLSEPSLVKLLVNSPIFAQTFQQARPYISFVEIDFKTKLPTTTLAVPIRNWNNQIDGVLVARINLNFLFLTLSETEVGKTGYSYVFDSRKILIAKKGSTPNNFKLEDLSNRPFIKNLSTLSLSSLETQPSISYLGLDGEEVLGAATRVRRVQWTVVVEQPTAQVYAPVWQMIAVMGGAMSGAILIAAIAGIIISKSIVLPLRKLTAAADRIRDGHLDTQVKITSDNELGLLAATFNKMAAQLAEFYYSLEQKVAERTTALTQANQALAHEITERKQAELEAKETLNDLQKTQSQLIQSEKMSSLGQLVAGVAHEINNPINFIHGNLFHINEYIQNLLDFVELYRQYYPEPQPELLKYIETVDLEFILEDLPKILSSMKIGTERIRQIVLSLRNFSRIDEAEMKPVNIHEGIDSTLLILQNRLKSKPDSPGIQMIKEYGNLPLVECYPGQLNQVFMNLLANAIDALEIPNPNGLNPTTKQNPQIIIRTSQPNPQSIIVQIADNGMGMTERVKAQLFNPFFTTKPVGKGTGLGLSISYQIIVEKHKGSLQCFSESGQGTEFFIEIPVQQSH